MTNKKLALEYTRTQAVLDNLLHTERLTIQDLINNIQQFYLVDFPDFVPTSYTLKEYYGGRRAMAIDSDKGREHVPSVLMAIELMYEGASDVYFHPIFNLAVGPVRSKTLTWKKGCTYPQEWIDALIDHKSRIEQRVPSRPEWKSDASDHDITPQMDACSLLSTEIQAAKDHNIALGKQRRKRWRIDDQLGWIHTTMLHLPLALESLFMVKPGSRATWRRNYRVIAEEINAVGPEIDLDRVALVWALMLEAAEIGDLDRLKSARLRLREMIPRLNAIPALRQCAGTLQEMILLLIDDSLLRCYAADVADTSGKPPEWRMLKREFLKYRPALGRK